MKKNILLLMFALALVFGYNKTVVANGDEFTQDILKMQDINGTSESFDALYVDILGQLKQSFPDAPVSEWDHMKETVFNPMVLELKQKMVPVLKKYYTHSEVKDIIAFYESSAGKKLAMNTTQISNETSMLSQSWATGLMENIQIYIATKSF